MKPVTFPEANVVMSKPEDMTQEQCGELPVLITVVDRLPHTVSVWELSKEEIETINTTGVIYLDILTGRIPPVMISVEEPEALVSQREYLKSKEN